MGPAAFAQGGAQRGGDEHGGGLLPGNDQEVAQRADPCRVHPGVVQRRVEVPVIAGEGLGHGGVAARHGTPRRWRQVPPGAVASGQPQKSSSESWLQRLEVRGRRDRDPGEPLHDFRAESLRPAAAARSMVAPPRYSSASPAQIARHPLLDGPDLRGDLGGAEEPGHHPADRQVARTRRHWPAPAAGRTSPPPGCAGPPAPGRWRCPRRWPG